MSTGPQEEQAPRTVSPQDDLHPDPSAGIPQDPITIGIGHVEQNDVPTTAVALAITSIMTLFELEEWPEIAEDVDMASLQAWNPIIKSNIRRKMTKGG